MTQEDLEEALDDVLKVLEILITRCKKALDIAQWEFKGLRIVKTLEENEFEIELKYLMYRLCNELKSSLVIFSVPEVLNSLHLPKEI